jgi:hypothetical protein
MTFFWFKAVKAPCGLAGRSRRFGEACCLHLQAEKVSRRESNFLVRFAATKALKSQLDKMASQPEEATCMLWFRESSSATTMQGCF